MDNMLCEKLPDKVAEFYEAIGGLGNVYHLYTENEKGEITSEAFGKNVITDYGLRYIHTYYGQSANSTSGYKIWIGNSTEQPTLESSSMTSLVSNKSATRYADGFGESSSYQSRYPGRFIPEKGLFVQNVDVAKQYFDYNIPDANGVTLTEPVTITEIGLGETSTALVSHALIYNSNGQVSSIVKKPNEKLFVTIYWQGAVPIAYIENNWSKDIATFIEPGVFAFPYRDHIAWCVGYTARSKHTNRNDISYNTYHDYNSNGMTTPVDHVSKYNATMSTPNKLYENNKSYVSSVTVANRSEVFEVYNSSSGMYQGSRYHYDGYAYYNTDYALYSFLQKFIEQPEPEEFDVINVFTDTFNNPNFNKALGMGNREFLYPNTHIDYFYHPYGMLPMTQADFKSITRYNHSTKVWDIEEEFFNAPDINYDNSAFTIGCKLWIENNINTGSGGTSFRVFCNPNYKTRKIISFSNSSITVYATDTYWDISSYEMISNLSVVPEELSQKRYYCVKTNSATWLYPNYDSNSMHYLIPRTQAKTYTGLITRGNAGSSYFNSKPLASDEGGWILLSKTLIYPDAEDGPTSYQIYGPMQYDGSDWTFTHGRWATKDKILIGQDTYNKDVGRYSAITFRLYTVGDPYNPPTYQDITLPFTTKGTSHSYYCRYSWSNDGYLCAHYTSINEAIILNVYDPDNPLKIQNALYTHISNISNYIVYQCSNITNVTRFNIMNIDGEIIDTFELPDTQTYTVRGILGWKNNVYIEATASSSGTISYHYDTNTHILSVIDDHWNVFRRDNTFYKYTEESNDECYVLMTNFDGDSNYKGNPAVISANDPLNPKYLLPTNLNWNDNSYKQFGWHGGMMFKIDNGKNLIFIAKTNAERVLLYDLGRRLDQTDPIREVPFGFYPSNTENIECGIYKDQVYYVVNSGDVYMYPVELWLAHNIKGTTKTITGVNNPFRLSGIKTNFGITNDISKVTSDNYDTSVNVVQ